MRAGTDTVPISLYKDGDRKIEDWFKFPIEQKQTPPYPASSLTVQNSPNKGGTPGDTISQTLLKDHQDPDMAPYAAHPGLRASDNPMATTSDNILVTSAKPHIIPGEKEETFQPPQFSRKCV